MAFGTLQIPFLGVAWEASISLPVGLKNPILDILDSRKACVFPDSLESKALIVKISWICLR